MAPLAHRQILRMLWHLNRSDLWVPSKRPLNPWHCYGRNRQMNYRQCREPPHLPYGTAGWSACATPLPKRHSSNTDQQYCDEDADAFELHDVARLIRTHTRFYVKARVDDDVPKKCSRSPDVRLVMQNDAQQRAVDFYGAIIINKAQFPKFVHEVTHTGARRANHLRERLLADLRNDRLGVCLPCQN